MGGGAETHERVDGERRAEGGLAVLPREADVAVAVLGLAGLVEEAVQDLVLPRPQDDELPALRAKGVPAQVLDETARAVVAVEPSR